MSLFPEAAAIAEPKWLADARRRNAPYAAAGDNDFSPAVLDRRALLKAHDDLARRLATLEDEATAARQELADQEVEKLRLVEELAALKLVDVAHRERNRRVIAAATAPPLTYNEAEKLAGAGWTPEKVAQINQEAPAPAPLAGEAGAADSQLPWNPGFTPKCHGCGLPSHAKRCTTTDCPAKPAAGAPLEREDAAGQPEKGGQGE